MRGFWAQLLGIVLPGTLLAACSGLPPLADRTESRALHDTEDTPLGQAIAPLARAHPGRSGVVALADAQGAFAARMLLAAAAQRTLDVQYYIWRSDLSGTLLLAALHRAAERGVRVRLLLDDNNTAGLDPLLAALNLHPNIEVRLFNPFVHRRLRWLGYFGDFARLNRRMHNKSFTADNQASIVGGRNVGDEYFGTGDAPLFVDLDMLAVGPVVRDVSSDFDRYWASASAYPVDRLLPAAADADLAHLVERAARIEDEPAAADYRRALARSDFVRRMLAGELAYEWVPVRMVSDDPAKGLGHAAPEVLIGQRLKEVLGTAAREVQLVSPYFVPTAAGVEALAALARQGVKVTVLTNSLAANDVAVVHAGYAKRRKALLEAGVALYEMMPRSEAHPGVAGRLGAGSSAASLHAKTFGVDRVRVFVGSFNFDPRSARLNTEMGFVIESQTLAQGLADTMADAMPQRAYEVRLGAGGALQWLERQGDSVVIHDTDPHTSAGLRLAVWFLSLLPIEWML